MSLAPDHRADLERSALTGAVIDALQIEAVRPHDIIKLSGVQSAYRLRYFTLDGQANCFERLRLFPPITTPDGHTQKYYQTPGSAPQCYLPPFFKWKTIATDCRHTILIAREFPTCKGGGVSREPSVARLVL